MAKRNSKDEKKLNYVEEVKKLNEQGPQSLYLMYGPEDYLREQFLTQLKKLCLADGDDSFSYRRINGPELDPVELAQAIDSVPFMSPRTFIELRDVDINKLKEPEEHIKLLSDIPDYCTVVFVLPGSYEPDKRIKLVKTIREHGYTMNFVQQSQGQLYGWVGRRFAAAGKSVDFDAVQRLIFVSGDLMNRLIPEIEKIAAYARGERVTVADVDAVAHHIPDADIFSITDFIAKKEYNNAVEILSELLADKSNEPIFILAILGRQMRQLYAARLAYEQDMDISKLMSVCKLKYEYHAKKLIASAKGFELEQLKTALRLCAEADYKMKSSSVDDRELLKELVIRIAAGT